MKSNHLIPLIALATPILLAGCASSSAGSSSSAVSDSSETSTVSSSSSSIASKYDLAALKIEFGEGSVSQTKNGMEVVEDSENSIYKLGLSADKKATYTLKGYIDWSIEVSNLGNLETIEKGCKLVLDGACLVVDKDTPAIQYLVDSKALTLQPQADTTNYIINLGSGAAVYSDNTVEVEDAGTLNVDSIDGNAFWGDEVRLYNAPTLNVSAGEDAFYGHKFITDDDEADPQYFTGTLAVKDVGKIAFDFTNGTGTEEDPYSGSINIESGSTVTVDNALNLAKTDVSLTVGGSLIATNISASDPIITKNTGNCAITVDDGATFKINGVDVTSKTI